MVSCELEQIKCFVGVVQMSRHSAFTQIHDQDIRCLSNHQVNCHIVLTLAFVSLTSGKYNNLQSIQISILFHYSSYSTLFSLNSRYQKYTNPCNPYF